MKTNPVIRERMRIARQLGWWALRLENNQLWGHPPEESRWRGLDTLVPSLQTLQEEAIEYDRTPAAVGTFDWVPVKQQLPPENFMVLVAFHNREDLMILSWTGEKWLDEEEYELVKPKAAYWRHLPKHPDSL